MRNAATAATVLAAVLVTAGYAATDDLVFIHHSVGEGWLNSGLNAALLAKSYIDERNDITYGTTMLPDAGRPASLGPVPGDNTDMNHWILWFNDYLGRVKSYGCSTGVNRIVLFKSCFPNSNIDADGAEPGDPFSEDKVLVNYKAIYRHPGGPGHVYSHAGRSYKPLQDVFAASPDTLFVVVTAPPLCYAPDETTNANAHRARLFNNWLKNTWLTGYNAAHPNLHNVAVFDLFDALAYPDNDPQHPNRLRSAYGGASGDSHPNDAGNQQLTKLFATNADNFLDRAWRAFHPLASDCNGDGRVDIVDVLILAAAFGSHSGDPAYNAGADVDTDADVDMADVLAVVSDFGK